MGISFFAIKRKMKNLCLNLKEQYIIVKWIISLLILELHSYQMDDVQNMGIYMPDIVTKQLLLNEKK